MLLCFLQDRRRREQLKGQQRAAAESKVCARCHQLQPQSEFYADPGRADGLQTYCKPCFSEAYKERRLVAQDAVRLPAQP